MPERDLFRRVLERILPWIDPAEYDRERQRTRVVIDRANRVLAEVNRVERVIRGSR